MSEIAFKTSLYRAKKNFPRFPDKKTMRDALWKHLKRVLEGKSNIKFIDDYQNFLYMGTLIGFRTRYSHDEDYFLLSFFPYGSDVTTWSKKTNEQAVNNLMNFCNELGEKIVIKVGGVTFDFERNYIVSFVDISDWEVSLKTFSPPQKRTLKEFLKSKDNDYKDIMDNLPKNNRFFIFTESFISEKKILEKLKLVLEDYGKLIGPNTLLSCKPFADKFVVVGDEIFIFIENEGLLKSWYSNLKIFLDANRIPSQYLTDYTLLQKLFNFSGVKANFLLEIMTKIGHRPVFLKPPEEITNVNAILCLSDIESTTRKLFGALFTILKEGTEIEEEIQIYNDIDFVADKYNIKLNEESIKNLVEKIKVMLKRKDVTLDILLTKEWKRETLENFLKGLKDGGIEAGSVYFISARTSRFSDDYITSNDKDPYKHPILSIDKKLAFLRTSTELRIYPNISYLYIKLLWPKDRDLEISDFIKVLWLTKKRIYRIQEFFVLKAPEPIKIFSDLKNMYLGEIGTKVTIPLRFLI